MITLEDIYSAYYSCKRNKANTKQAIKFSLDLESNLIKLYNDIINKRYKIGPSIAFIVTRPKLREVFAANFRDRIVHHLLIDRLEPLFEQDFIEDSYSCRKGKGTLYGVLRLKEKIRIMSENYTKDCWIGKFDIHGFFMSINKIILAKKLKEYINQRYQGDDKDIILYLARKIVEHRPQDNCFKQKSSLQLWSKLPSYKSLFTCDPNCGLPIGNLTSQCFANFYMNEFDHMMTEMFNGFYGRYVDDFYVIGKTKKDITKKIPIIRKFLKDKLHLELHPSKMYIQPYYHGLRFIGYYIKKDLIKLGNVCIGNLYDAIMEVNKETPCQEGAIKITSTLNSYFGFLRQDTIERRKEFWDMLDKKWKGYVFINKDYTVVRLNPICNPLLQIKKKLMYGD